MSQMVFPQNLPKSASSEAASPSGAARTANGKSGESSFDAVSRSESKRLDTREVKASATEKRAEKDRQSHDEKSAITENTEEAAGQNLVADLDQPHEPDGDQLLISSPLTFTDFQSLVTPLQTQSPPAMAKATAASPNVQGLPFVHNSLTAIAGSSGNGTDGAMTLQAPGGTGSAPGFALAENLLAGVSGDSGKASDSPMLQNATRFQGALESVSAQASAVNTPKLAPDGPMLRGYATFIELPVSHAEWGDRVAGKLTWLTARNMSVAEIHLTPPDMGPMEVRVQVQQEQASITVHSANPVVREQLELHSHRLRDMLGEQGISLENFDVSDSGSDQTRDGDTEGDERPVQALMADAGQEELGAELQSLDLSWKGEVDIFA